MDELLKRLETQIKTLIERQSALKQSNQHLTQREFYLSREKDSLLQKHKKTINTIEGLVTRLKALEGQL